ncbi:hypothetical protein R3P38DRAFT_2808285 [Favolaschia claudopus]|uniref:Uncharacterized protein n=1 Tax=Favolaschia claudopus TaxID=2862362 RepID=A0AAV9ZGI5_9AGAR
MVVEGRNRRNMQRRSLIGDKHEQSWRFRQGACPSSKILAVPLSKELLPVSLASPSPSPENKGEFNQRKGGSVHKLGSLLARRAVRELSLGSNRNKATGCERGRERARPVVKIKGGSLQPNGASTHKLHCNGPYSELSRPKLEVGSKSVTVRGEFNSQALLTPSLPPNFAEKEEPTFSNTVSAREDAFTAVKIRATSPESVPHHAGSRWRMLDHATSLILLSERVLSRRFLIYVTHHTLQHSPITIWCPL